MKDFITKAILNSALGRAVDAKLDFASGYPTKRCLNTLYGSAAMKSAYPLVVRRVVIVDFESAYPRIFN